MKRRQEDDDDNHQPQDLTQDFNEVITDIVEQFEPSMSIDVTDSSNATITCEGNELVIDSQACQHVFGSVDAVSDLVYIFEGRKCKLVLNNVLGISDAVMEELAALTEVEVNSDED